MYDGMVFPAPSEPSYGVSLGCNSATHSFVHIPRLPGCCVDHDPTHEGFIQSLLRLPKEREGGLERAERSAALLPGRAVELGEDPTWGIGLLVRPAAVESRSSSASPRDFDPRSPSRPLKSVKPRLLIYGHPNAVDVQMMLPELQYYATSLELSVLGYEFRGYGMCDGKPSAEEVVLDLKSALRFAVNALDYELRDIILMGRSIGTGPAVELAAAAGRLAWASRNAEVRTGVSENSKYSPCLLLLEAPFTSIRDCTASITASLGASLLSGIVSGLVGERFRSIDKIGDVECPIVIVHGMDDKIVPFQHGHALSLAANKAFYARHGATKEAADRDAGTVHCLLHALERIGHNDIPASATMRALAASHPAAVGPCPLLMAPLPQAANFTSSRRPAPTLSAARILGQYDLEHMLRFRYSDPQMAWPNPDREHDVRSLANLGARIGYSCAALASALRLAWIEYARCVMHAHQARELTRLEVGFGLPSRQAGQPKENNDDDDENRSCANDRPGSPARVAVEKVHPLTAAEFVDACLAVWGSPFAVYRVSDVPASLSSPAASGAAFVVFGEYVAEDGRTGLGSYFDDVWRSVNSRCRRRRAREASPKDGDATTDASLPVLEPVFFTEASSAVRRVLCKNMERTSTVAINMALDAKTVAASAVGGPPGKASPPPPSPPPEVRSATSVAAVAAQQQRSPPPESVTLDMKISGLTERGQEVLQLEIERFVLCAATSASAAAPGEGPHGATSTATAVAAAMGQEEETAAGEAAAVDPVHDARLMGTSGSDEEGAEGVDLVALGESASGSVLETVGRLLDHVPLRSAPDAAEEAWFARYRELAEPLMRFGRPCVTADDAPAAIAAWHNHADELRRHTTGTAVAAVAARKRTSQPIATASSSPSWVVPRPDPYSAAVHARDVGAIAAGTAASSPTTESEAARGLRALKERRDRRQRASDGDCVVQ